MLRLSVGNPYSGQYEEPKEYAAKRLLPSLEQVTLVGSVDASKTYMLMQREAYDHQWRAYTTIWQAILGVGGVASQRCDGYANCYEVKEARIYYLLYTPERLTAIGWVIVAFAAAFCLRPKRWRTSA